MKIAFIKQPWCVAWSWDTTYFTTPRKMLDSFYYKSSLFSLLAEFKGDVFVMESSTEMLSSGDYQMWYTGDPDACKEIYDKTHLTAWASVPWDAYDIIISAGRIIPEPIIRAYPDKLWVVIEGEYTAPSYDPTNVKPYDLFWDYTDVNQLPYMAKPRTMRAMTGLAAPGKGAIWLPSRAVRPHYPERDLMEGERYQPCIELGGLPVYHPKIWNLGRTYRAILDGLVQTPRQIWLDIAMCRYTLSVNTGAIGQPILEAAALGSIVVATPQPYDVLVAPECRVQSFAQGIEVIELLEAFPAKRAKILNYQSKVIHNVFWERPLELLLRARRTKLYG